MTHEKLVADTTRTCDAIKKLMGENKTISLENIIDNGKGHKIALVKDGYVIRSVESTAKNHPIGLYLQPQTHANSAQILFNARPPQANTLEIQRIGVLMHALRAAAGKRSV